jgi:uncharacterized lipoprotein YddW (UPF0748 family)
MKLSSRLLALVCILFFTSTTIQAQASAKEFRGVWVATVDNIDWPSKGNFDSDSQKVEFIKLLDMHQRNGMNAVIVQIRPCTDAFYPSQYEPWSAWLTGIQGQPTSPYYDPLQFMIEETHKRNMVFHAWMNPYRAEFYPKESLTSSTHITRLHPEWFVTYGDKRYFDPGNRDAQQYVVDVVTDIVKRYKVDAIHFDDYFYPYPLEGKKFPDDETYRQYGKGMTRENWRRSNTDSIIANLYAAIKKEDSSCLFGISPFGVWRNADRDAVNGSKTVGSLSNYDDLYADILLWLKNDWIDYVAPQLYWEFGHKRAPFEVLLNWWGKHTYGKQCYIGIGVYKAKSNSAWNDKQLPRQMEALRNTPNINGVVFYSSKSLESNPYGFADSLRLNYFKEKAEVPVVK